jgi:zinc transport system permease protein
MEWLEPLQYPFFQRALIAGLLAAVACGIVGTYVVVRNISSIAGGLSHAAFGGVGLGYWLGFSPMLGGALFAVTAGLGVGVAFRRLGSGLDTLIAMMWSVGMALGILFVSLREGYAPDLLSFLFGNILFVPSSFIVFVAILDLVILVLVGLLFDELRAVCFDEEFARLRGVPVELVFLLLMALISVTVVILIRIVGVILVIALLTMPTATARQWSNSLSRMMLLSTALGAICTVLGLFLSWWAGQAGDLGLPPGPTIILLAAVMYGASSLLRRVKFLTSKTAS